MFGSGGWRQLRHCWTRAIYAVIMAGETKSLFSDWEGVKVTRNQ